MAKHTRRRHPAWLSRLCATLAAFWRTYLPWPTHVEVVVADARRRRSLKRDVSRGVRRLRRFLGERFPAHLAVIVQQGIYDESQPASKVQRIGRQKGGQAVVVRLALQVNGRRLSTDDILALLTEQCLRLAAGQPTDSTVTITGTTPDGDGAPNNNVAGAGLPPDPLLPYVRRYARTPKNVEANGA